MGDGLNLPMIIKCYLLFYILFYFIQKCDLRFFKRNNNSSFKIIICLHIAVIIAFLTYQFIGNYLKIIINIKINKIQYSLVNILHPFKHFFVLLTSFKDPFKLFFVLLTSFTVSLQEIIL